MFSEPAYSFDIPENAPRGYQVGLISASDPDLGANSMLTYTVISDWANDVFSLNPQTGVFTLTARLDYEEVSNIHKEMLPTRQSIQWMMHRHRSIQILSLFFNNKFSKEINQMIESIEMLFFYQKGNVHNKHKIFNSHIFFDGHINNFAFFRLLLFNSWLRSILNSLYFFLFWLITFLYSTHSHISNYSFIITAWSPFFFY